MFDIFCNKQINNHSLRFPGVKKVKKIDNKNNCIYLCNWALCYYAERYVFCRDFFTFLGLFKVSIQIFLNRKQIKKVKIKTKKHIVPNDTTRWLDI